MFRKIQASLLALFMTLAVVVLTGRQSEQTAAAASSSLELLGALHESDFIVYVDAQRMMTEIIPGMLAERPEELAKFKAMLDEIQKDTGLDPRLLDAVAIGVNASSPTRTHPSEFAVIARGRFDANTTIDVGFAAAVKESRGRMERQQQQYEGRIIHTLAPARPKQTPPAPATPDAAQTRTAPPVENTTGDAPVIVEVIPPTENQQDMVREREGNQLAILALDSNTLAIGTLNSVRATIDASMGRNKVSDELVQLATRTPNAVVSFSGNVSPEIIRSLRLGGSDARDSIASIRQVYGSFNTTGSDGEAFINLRTEAAEQARQLSMALNALKFAARFSGEQVSARNKSIEALIQDVNIEAVGNEVQMRLKLAQTDLAPFWRIF
jgi:hypothetical protein